MPADQRQSFSRWICRQNRDKGFNSLMDNPKAPKPTDPFANGQPRQARRPQLALLGCDALNCADHLQNPPGEGKLSA
ncbi:hypothetical protein FOXYSP1_08329 [Fusarium oxysporum f. sp. phaseoli]